MLSTLAEKIRDNRFLRLVDNMLQAGYLEDWIWNATLSGVPQGGCVSPVLSNIYLHRLDSFVESVLIPEYTRGGRRARNPAYLEVASALARARRQGDRAGARRLSRKMRSLPSVDPHDPGYRRLRYVRYADDHLLGFTGPRAEAEEIKARLAAFLRDDLKLELSADKTLITHARTGAARFLGYEITVGHDNRQFTRGQRSVNGAVQLRVPKAVITAKAAPYLARGKPARRPRLVNHDDYDIVRIYGAEYRGIVQYYLLAGNVSRLHRLHWVMVTSMLKTLACKHRSSVSKIAAKHQAKIITPHGPRRCFEASVGRGGGRKPLVARFGGIPLRRQKTAVLTDRLPDRITYARTELVSRLMRATCELCDQPGGVEVHHVRKLADLARPGTAQQAWEAIMARRRRKTLVVCAGCHGGIHASKPAEALTA
jgi:Type II intron maturase/Reverse transcriptase (RNA-dependent DNA polymerase)